jgi:hypothetical protein
LEVVAVERLDARVLAQRVSEPVAQAHDAKL